MAYLQSKIQSAKAAVFGNVSTAISIVAGAVILGEPLYAYHIICSVFIVTGALGINFSGRRGGKNEVRISDGK
jgi:drug/metabolite transporter (DMT)-like permease